MPPAEQDAGRALVAADTGCVPDLGRVQISGPARELLTDPQPSERCLGGRPGEPATSPKK